VHLRLQPAFDPVTELGQLGRIQRCFSRMACSMSAIVTQRGAVILKPSSLIRKPMVRRFERCRLYSSQ
jgi:hypothetical protein